MSGTAIPEPSFNGDEVTYSSYYPNLDASSLEGTATATVVPGTVTFPNTALDSVTPEPAYLGTAIDLDGATITETFPAADEGVLLSTGAFNGITLQTAAGDAAITGVSVTSTNISGLTNADLTVTANSVDINLSGLVLPDTAPATYTLTATFAACYVSGTRIATCRGEVAVEDLLVGDRVITASGAERPIRWIGRRSYAGRFLAANPQVQPVCMQAGSLGNGLPRRALSVSPNHAMLLDGSLVPAGCLVNGRTIVQQGRIDQVDYFHVELDSHDVILAEGAPAETFLDDGSRGVFQNSAAPDFTQRAGTFCAPREEAGYRVEAIRARLEHLAGMAAAAA